MRLNKLEKRLLDVETAKKFAPKEINFLSFKINSLSRFYEELIKNTLPVEFTNDGETVIYTPDDTVLKVISDTSNLTIGPCTSEFEFGKGTFFGITIDIITANKKLGFAISPDANSNSLIKNEILKA